MNLKRAEYYREWRRKNLDKARAISRRAYHKDPHKQWVRLLKKQYGLTEQDYCNMFAQQEGRCAICDLDQGAQDRKLNVDHDHQTGYVRGLLCDSCNKALGLMHDSMTSFERAAQYLEQSNTRQNTVTSLSAAKKVG